MLFCVHFIIDNMKIMLFFRYINRIVFFLPQKTAKTKPKEKTEICIRNKNHFISLCLCAQFSAYADTYWDRSISYVHIWWTRIPQHINNNLARVRELKKGKSITNKCWFIAIRNFNCFSARWQKPTTETVDDWMSDWLRRNCFVYKFRNINARSEWSGRHRLAIQSDLKFHQRPKEIQLQCLPRSQFVWNEMYNSLTGILLFERMYERVNKSAINRSTTTINIRNSNKNILVSPVHLHLSYIIINIPRAIPIQIQFNSIQTVSIQ